MIQITDDFECGAVEEVRFLSPRHIVFHAPLRGSPQGMWFAFRIRGGKGQSLTFEQGNVPQMLGAGGYGAVRPVVREGTDGEWRRLSDEQVRWELETHEFRFTFTPQTEETYVAFCYPYGLSDLEAFLSRHRDHPELRTGTLCRTGEGRDFPLLWLGETAAPDKHLCAFVARQHAGEVPGSYVLEGIMEAYLSDTDAGEWCRRHLTFLVAPLIDLDGVVTGRYGKDRPPRDFNRDWCARPVHSEIRALIPALHEITRQYAYCLFVDLHAPGPGDVSFWLPSRLSYGTPQWDETWNFGRHLEELAPAECPVKVEDYTFKTLNWSQELYECTATYFQAFRYGVHASTLEISYHRHAGGGYVTPEGWRGLGYAFVEAMVRHLQETEFQPAPRPYTWGEAPPHFEGWTLPAVPRGARLEEVSPTRMAIHPTEAENLVWFTCNEFFPLSGDSPYPFLLKFEGEVAPETRLEILAYFYEEWLPTGERCHIELEPGVLAYGWTGEDVPPGCDAVRFSVRVRDLDAPLTFSIEEGPQVAL